MIEGPPILPPQESAPKRPQKPDLGKIESLTEARRQVVDWLKQHPEDVKEVLGTYQEIQEQHDTKSDQERIERALDIAEIKHELGMSEAAFISFNQARYEAQMFGNQELAAKIEAKMRELGGEKFIQDEDI